MTLIFIALLTLAPLLEGQTIAEKKASLTETPGDLDKDTEKFLLEINRELSDDQETLKKLYSKARELYNQKAPEEDYKSLLKEIQSVKLHIDDLENSWRLVAAQHEGGEPYALWHQPDTTLGQLIIDYGAQDYVYIIPREIADLPLSIGSNLPIPRSSWNQMLEQILTQNGVGMRQLNPFLRELYLFKNDKSGIKLITNQRSDLSPLPPTARIAFILSPDPAEVRRTYFFLDNFVNHASSIVQLVGRDILLMGDVQEIQDLLKLSDFLGANRGEVEWRAVSLTRITPDEMSKILSAIFNPTVEKEARRFPLREAKKNEPAPPPDANGLKVIKLAPPATGLFLVGTKEEIRKAENVIRDVENQIGGGREKLIHWYTVKYSDPDELADILLKIYTLMIKTGTGKEKGSSQDLLAALENQFAQEREAQPVAIPVEEAPAIGEYFPPDSYFDGGFPVNPSPVRPPDSREKKRPSNRTNFIVDQKTSAIVMVVEADILPSIKDLIRKLDVPKKMVQLEVLLFEKRKQNINEFGLDLLRMGSCAKDVDETCVSFSDRNRKKKLFTGVFDFLISRKENHNFPAFDALYRFILSQEDVTINSNPSVVTVNQTPAFIAVLEEQSIDTGSYQLEEANIVALQSFKRAQFGTTIKITPTIHLSQEGDKEPFDSITLESDIMFDTVVSNHNDRPVVVRRKITNEARVADGETIILGGLRRKDSRDGSDGIPFLGEIPGIGKLFSFTKINDTSTEMFIFITPKIIADPSCGLETIRQIELCRRPGDLPEFMSCLVEAQQFEKDQLFQHAMTMLFGRQRDCLNTPGWHNDDTCHDPNKRLYGEYDGR
jgi:general secretion pathway protein D